MLDLVSDTVNRDLEIRDIYNMEDAFGLRPDYLGAYRSRINGGLAFDHGLDGKTDWPLDAQRQSTRSRTCCWPISWRASC